VAESPAAKQEPVVRKTEPVELTQIPGPAAKPPSPKTPPGVQPRAIAKVRPPSSQGVQQPDEQNNDPDGAMENEADGGNPIVWSADQEGILEAIRTLKPKIQECYAGWMNSGADGGVVEGKVTLKMVIETVEGEDYASMKNTKIMRDGLEHEFLTGCIINLTESIRFEPPDEPITVRFPFVFSGSEPP
jgi:hypothetical protein